MVIKIRGRKHWLWRAVDDEDKVLDFLVQPRCCARSARRLLRKLLKKHGLVPKRITTDKFKSYAVTIRKERPLTCQCNVRCSGRPVIRPAKGRCGQSSRMSRWYRDR
ncbi:MAG: DDE-type integrase/transposase/recombinase [Alphaproteobacteria bacterium]|nr:DDE-type integrase/transposase/recombinase [Alphaproteobacteria bacterium]